MGIDQKTSEDKEGKKGSRAYLALPDDVLTCFRLLF